MLYEVITDRLRVSLTTLRELYYGAKVPYVKIGRKVFLRPQDIDRYIALGVRNADALGDDNR